MIFNLAKWRSEISGLYFYFFNSTSWKKGVDCVGTHITPAHFLSWRFLWVTRTSPASLFPCPYLSATAPVRVAIHRGRGSGAGFVQGATRKAKGHCNRHSSALLYCIPILSQSLEAVTVATSSHPLVHFSFIFIRRLSHKRRLQSNNYSGSHRRMMAHTRILSSNSLSCYFWRHCLP